MSFCRKMKKKDRPSKKKQFKVAVDYAVKEKYKQKFLNKNLGRVVDGRLTAMMQYAMCLLNEKFGKTREDIEMWQGKLMNAIWAVKYSWKQGLQCDKPTVKWEDVRHNLEREIRFKLPRWPRFGYKDNEFMNYAFNELDKAETVLLDMLRAAFGWGRVTLTKFQTALREMDFSSDYNDYLYHRQKLIEKTSLAAELVDEKTFYDGKYEKPRIKYAA